MPHPRTPGLDRTDPPDGLSPWARTWVDQALGRPTAIQRDAWPVLASGRDAVLVAPTGSGKTLAAFLAAIDTLAHTQPKERGRVLYISPLKALASDIERNLRSPLVGLEQVAAREGVDLAPITVGIRTGDTPQAERSRQAKNPPDIWITTPESLFLLLTSRARSALTGVTTVIIDEVHALADTKRGAHLALSLERLDELLESPAQRIALSATVTPVSEVARYVRSSDPSSVVVVAPVIDKQIEVLVEAPVDDFRDIGAPRTDDTGNEIVTGSAAGDADRTSVWPAVAERVLDIITENRSTIVFVNSRRLAERLTARINDAAAERQLGEVIARAHHGSVSKDVRRSIEDDLKQGRLRAVVATSSMELGIDMGAVDVVVQIQAPTSVASGLQRVGRAGHGVGQVSRGYMISTHPHDLLISTTLADRMGERELEPMRVPSLPLDVLAQQIVAMCAMDEWTFDHLAEVVRRSASFAPLSDALLTSVVNMLSGTYPSERFAELRPRLVWDRATNTLTGRPGSARLAVTNAGTIPDRGLFGVHVATEGFPRVGELDEEMVYESRVGEVITLGASTWRIEEITHDRVLVSPAPGAIGRMPFWHGDAAGRPAQLASAIGASIRGSHADAPALDSYLADQRASTGLLPDDRTVVIEAFRDEIGDWRVVVHSPYGARVHAPWALAMARNLHDSLGIDAQVMHADDGIVVRLPDYVPDVPHADGEPSRGMVDEGQHVVQEMIDALSIEPDDIEHIVHAEVTGSALFASRFRECAGRSLLLPRRRPDRRTPLWQQRQRASHLLQVAADFPDFPIVLETMRECLNDVYDVPALRSLLERIQSGDVRVETVMTDHPSPFARSLLFGYVATFLYEGDAPLAERRAQALSVDTELLADLLGTSELRSLLDPDALAEVEADLSFRSDHTRARSLEDAADLLRMAGPLDPTQATTMGIDDAWLIDLVAAGRAIEVTVAGMRRIAAIEDAGRLRDALGVVLPPGIPDAHLAPVDDPLTDVVARFARTHGPFDVVEVADHWGIPVAAIQATVERMVAARALLRGEFRPGARGIELCDPDVLRRIRRRSVAKLRQEIEPVDISRYAAFLPRWHGIRDAESSESSESGLVDVMDRLSGLVLPASAVLGILRSRIPGIELSDLDALLSAGDLTWWSMGEFGTKDARIAWAPTSVAAGIRTMLRGSQPALEDGQREQRGQREQPEQPDQLDSPDGLDPASRAIINVLSGGGAFLPDALHAALVSAGTVISTDTMERRLWDLARAGWITCDSWSYVHAQANGRRLSPRKSVGRSGSRRRALPRRTRLSTAMSGRSTGPRWSLAAGIARPSATIATEQVAAEYAGLLLERWGIVTRMAVSAEDPRGGFAGQYPVLSALADAGICQRIYAIEGAGGAQFALPGTVDDIRDTREPSDPQRLVLSAVDPANPFGNVLAWPEGSNRASRRTGALVVIAGSELLAWLDPSGTKLETWGVTDTEAATELLRTLSGQRERLTDRPRAILTSVDGASLIDAPATALWNEAAREAGLAPVPRGWRWVHRA